MTRSTLQGQVRRDLANDGRELEAVAGKTAAENDIGVFRMMIDHEIAVGREAVHARFGFAKIRGRPGHPSLHRARDGLDICLQMDFAIEFVSRCDLAAAVKCRFHAVAKIRESIKRRR